MSKLNKAPRAFTTVFRQSTVLYPNFDSKNYPRMSDYIDVPTIHTRGSWSVVHMVDEDTFVQMAIMANHITPDARKRYAHSRGGR